MYSKIEFPIIQKTKTLFSLDFNFFDVKIYALFMDNSSILNKTGKSKIKSLSLLINCFLGFQDRKLNLISFLNNKSTNKILSEFLFVLNNNGFPIEQSSAKTYHNCLISLLNQINKTHNTNISPYLIEDITFLNNFNNNRTPYFNGWWINLPRDIYPQSIFLHNFFDKFGFQETNNLFSKIQNLSNTQTHIFKQSINVLNKFLIYFSANVNDLQYWDKELIIKNFMKDFFINKDKENRDLNIAKKEWNFFNQILMELFDLSNDLLLTLNTKEKKGFERKIKISDNGLLKTKLITEIPLEICDDKAFELLIRKINQEVDLIKDWANVTITTFEENLLLKKISFQSIYGKKRTKIPKLISQNISVEQIFQKKHALAIAYLLISEHPEITESFLLNCHFKKSIHHTDQGILLVSDKNRKGAELAEQKVLLNNKTSSLIQFLLTATIEMREHLKEQNNEDYKKLFICCNSTNLFPFAPKILNEREGVGRETNKSLINFLVSHKEIQEESAINFANKVTLTKMRASVAVQVYLKTKSTTKMAQALGHTRYRPELLEHYLPEAILDFFQKRWISLFQKGIICEAMKDSEFLLKASNFSSMEQLHEFLKNHTIKNIPDNTSSLMSNQIDDYQNNKLNKNKFDEVYISLDEYKLSALISLKQAVTKSENIDNISKDAFFWSSFTDKLIHEINQNRIYSSFKPLLVIAEKNINSDLFKEIIYVK